MSIQILYHVEKLDCLYDLLSFNLFPPLPPFFPLKSIYLFSVHVLYVQDVEARGKHCVSCFIVLHLIPWREVLLINLKLVIWTFGYNGSQQALAILLLLSSPLCWAYVCLHVLPGFLQRFQASNLRSSCLQSKCSIHWAVSPVIFLLFFIASFLHISDWPDLVPLPPKFKACRWEPPGWLPASHLLDSTH